MQGRNVSPGESANRLGTAGVRIPPEFAPIAEAYGERLDARRLRFLAAARTDSAPRGVPPRQVAPVRSPFPAHPLPVPPRDAVLAAYGRPVGPRGRRPRDDPAFTASPIGVGLDSVSVTPARFAVGRCHDVVADAALDTSTGEEG
ncbi:hypothetical protein [Streptomyces sp. NPDC059604]|uniref:hypothetical protein n=1 Tax=Streptomyces sp. NPDC059604 TaxID=3346881 RepID=UPI003686686E